MRFVIVLSCLILAAMSNPMTHLDYEWKEWKFKHGKTYTDASEELRRREIWEMNLAFVDQHNADVRKGKHSYTVKMNHFADMGPEELSQMLNCLNVDITDYLTDYDTPVWQDDVGELPSSVDWRERGCVTGVKDQGDCNSCWAFAATGALEALHYNKTGELVSLSEQNLIDCSREYGNRGCQSGWPHQAYNYTIDNGGIDTNASYSYEGNDNNPCRFNRENIGAVMKDYVKIATGSEPELQKVVAYIGPVSVCIDGRDKNFHLLGENVYNNPLCTRTPTHCLLVVGYGNDPVTGFDYWLVKNSWGKDWGVGGYGKMRRNMNNQCGIADHAIYPI